MTWHARKQENMTHRQNIYQLLETNPDMAEVMELANGDVKQLQTGSIYSRK